MNSFRVAVIQASPVLQSVQRTLGKLQALVADCARHLAPTGALVCGFQLDRGYGIDEFDEHCRRVGLDCVERWATWSRDPFAGGDYAVSVHRFLDPDE